MIVINKIKLFAALSLLFFFGHTQTQTADDRSLDISILNAAFDQDTVNANKSMRKLKFTLKIKSVVELESFTVNLIDRAGMVTLDLGEYKVIRHQNGFYYAENKLREKKTIFNDEIYFYSFIPIGDLSKIRTIKLNYQSTAKNSQVVTKTLPN